MSTSSLSHLLQDNRTAGPSLQASIQDGIENAPADALSYNQVQVAPATIAPVIPTPLGPVSASPNVTYYPHSGIAATPVAADQSHSMTSSLYQCAHCMKRYSRPEHLARHIQTHTLGKRFFCQVCGKAFARADLLKRHAANHENDGDGTKKRRRIDASPGSGRVSHACRPCASARVKCEEIKPCQRCQKKGLACEYPTTEAGSAAAMHLLHLSADTRNHVQTPGAASSASQFGPASQDQRLMPLGTELSTIPETRDTMLSMEMKPEQDQLRTPDAILEQCRSQSLTLPWCALTLVYICWGGELRNREGLCHLTIELSVLCQKVSFKTCTSICIP